MGQDVRYERHQVEAQPVSGRHTYIPFYNNTWVCNDRCLIPILHTKHCVLAKNYIKRHLQQWWTK